MADGQEMELGVFSPKLEEMNEPQAVRFGVALCNALLAQETERGWHGALYPRNINYTKGLVFLGEPLELGGSFSPDELEYLPPELFWSGIGGPATDVYSVGLLLYAACSGGRVAFADSGELTPELRAAAATRRMKGEALRAPRDAGDELAQIILRAAAYREEERWPDLMSLRCALEDCSIFSDAVPAAKPESAAAPAGDSKSAPVVVPAPDKPPQAIKAPPKPEKPASGKAKAEPEVPEGHPRPVYDVLNEKKKAKKTSPAPIIATIVALVAIFLGVMYFLKSCNAEEEDPVTTPPVSENTDAPVTEPDISPAPTETHDPLVRPNEETEENTEGPEVPDVTPPEQTEESGSIRLLQTGSASWSEAKAACDMQGGHLPRVNDLDDLKALIAAAEAEGVSYVWLDAKKGTDGIWRDSDGAEIGYLPWYKGEPSGTDTDGSSEDYLMLWKYNNVWGYNDMRSDPGTAYAKYYGGRIAVFCEK